MHVTDVERRFLGGFGLVGAHLPLAAGTALASTHQGRAEVTMAVLGDGAAGNGVFGETVGLAAHWNLPLVLVVIRNLGAYATVEEGAGVAADLQRRAEGLSVKTLACNGMDIVDTHAVCADAVRIARTERRPVLVQVSTLRAPTASPTSSRPEGDRDELAAWKARDPLAVFGDRLVEVGLIESADRARVQMQVGAVIEQAVSFAGRSPHPEPESLYDHLLVPSHGGPAWRAIDVRGSSADGEHHPHAREASR